MRRDACTRVTLETVRHFVHLAASERTPRHLRFLRMVIAPEGSVLRANQDLVVDALADCRDALVLYNDAKGEATRDALTEVPYCSIAAVTSRMMRGSPDRPT